MSTENKGLGHYVYTIITRGPYEVVRGVCIMVGVAVGMLGLKKLGSTSSSGSAERDALRDEPFSW